MQQAAELVDAQWKYLWMDGWMEGEEETERKIKSLEGW